MFYEQKKASILFFLVQQEKLCMMVCLCHFFFFLPFCINLIGSCLLLCFCYAASAVLTDDDTGAPGSSIPHSFNCRW